MDQKALEVYPSAVKNYRSGRSFPDDSVAERLAVLANLDRGYTVACVHAQRAGETSQEGLWHYVAAKLSSGQRAGSVSLAILAAVILSAMLGFDGGPDGGALLSSVANVAQNAANGLYIMSTVVLILGALQALASRGKPRDLEPLNA